MDVTAEMIEQLVIIYWVILPSEIRIERALPISTVTGRSSFAPANEDEAQN